MSDIGVALTWTVVMLALGYWAGSKAIPAARVKQALAVRDTAVRQQEDWQRRYTAIATERAQYQMAAVAMNHAKRITVLERALRRKTRKIKTLQQVVRGQAPTEET